MTGTDLRANRPTANASPQRIRRRKDVLFCPACGHESPIDGDWLTSVEDGSRQYVCPVCDTVVSSR